MLPLEYNPNSFQKIATSSLMLRQLSDNIDLPKLARVEHDLFYPFANLLLYDQSKLGVSRSAEK